MPFESPQRLMGDSFASPSSSMAAPASQIPIIPYEKIDQARIHNTDGFNILMPAPDMPDPTLRPAAPEMGIEPVEEEEEAPITTMPVKEEDQDPSAPGVEEPAAGGGLLSNKKLLIGGGSLVLIAAALGFYFFWYKKKGVARK